MTEEAASSPFSQHPDVAYNLSHNDWLVVYVANLSGATSGLDIYGRRVRGVDSVPESEEPIDEFDGNQTQPTVAAYRPNFPPHLVTYADYWAGPDGNVRGILLEVGGRPPSDVYGRFLGARLCLPLVLRGP